MHTVEPPPPQTPNHRSQIHLYLLKKSPYKWISAVQTHVVHGSTCQLMLISTSSTPTGIPMWRVVKKKTLFNAKQLNCDTALLQASIWLDSSALFPDGLLCCAPCRLVLHFAGLLHSALVRHLWCFSSAWVMQSSVLGGKHSVLPQPEGSWLIWTSPHPLVPDCLSSHKWGL